MNGDIDDKAFEEYLKRGSPVSQHYQALDSDETPADIDSQVLARAKEAVRSPVARKTRAWQRWSVPVALAASTVLAISIVIESGQHESTLTRAPSYSEPAPEMPSAAHQVDEQKAEPSVEHEVIAPAAPTEAVRAGSVARERAADAPRDQMEQQSEPRAAARPRVEALAKRATPEAEVDREVAADTPMERARQRSVDDLDDQAMQAARAPVHPVPAAPPPAAVQQSAPVASAAKAESPSSASEREARADPEIWLREIRELRASGKAEEADREWKAFREAFPDHAVAEDDPAMER